MAVLAEATRDTDHSGEARLDHLSELQTPAVAARVSLRDWREHGPVTLALSSGYFGCYARTGRLHTLCREQDAATTLKTLAIRKLTAGVRRQPPHRQMGGSGGHPKCRAIALTPAPRRRQT